MPTWPRNGFQVAVGSDMLGAHTLAVSRNGRLYSPGAQGGTRAEAARCTCEVVRARKSRLQVGATAQPVASAALPTHPG